MSLRAHWQAFRRWTLFAPVSAGVMRWWTPGGRVLINLNEPGVHTGADIATVLIVMSPSVHTSSTTGNSDQAVRILGPCFRPVTHWQAAFKVQCPCIDIIAVFKFVLRSVGRLVDSES